jgi:hypothetical protein
MNKYIAFDLYRKNDLGGHEKALHLQNQPHGVQVVLVAEVESFVAEIPAYLLDENDSHYCPQLKAAVRDLMGS